MCTAVRLTRLTPREQDILARLSTGKTNNMIAGDLGISGGTVKVHVRSILRKLKISSRVEAAIIAVKHGVAGYSHPNKANSHNNSTGNQ